MTANQLLAMLQEQIAKRPEVGDKEVLITRDNGKRTFVYHEIEAWGWRQWDCGDSHGRVLIALDFDGTKY